jgi:mono/diheme cytochrome c family protein
MLAIALAATSCGEKEKKEKDGFEINRSQAEEKAPESVEVPVDLSNKGVGPITDLTFPDSVDEELAAKGKSTFEAICIACHMTDQRMIGPAMTGVYERRSPEWVMNMILNPDEMLLKDPIAKALLKEYNNMIMLDQNLSEEDARAVAEYLRTL